ncbi:hypothetical protein [Brevundimonas sp. TWP2-3-2]|uniref:hypothetical protein n=1 Tax=unclassified Brevundimonas TaxID=2622653 RepID=UPI003CF0EBE9
MRGVVLAALIATPALAGSQRLSDDLRMPEFEGGRAVARIMVLQEAPWPNREITLYAVRPDRLGIDPLDGPLSAIAISTNGPPQVARSADCPVLRAGMEALRALPPVSTAPTPLVVRPPGTLLMLESKKDGARYEITVEVAAPNGSAALLTINDYGGDYAAWAYALDRDLHPCWTRWP